MEIYSCAGSVGHAVDRFGSAFVLSPLASSAGPAHVACVHLAAGGTVGEHDALADQLFCVVDGEGWVSGADAARRSIHPMEAAYWRSGERHAAGTDSGMVAVIMEAAAVEPLAARAP
jgi:quercetin dioxygenase-like cupin family protein